MSRGRTKNPRSWPKAAEIRRVLKHLEKLGLSVYGECYDPKTAWHGPANMDFDAPTILKYRQDWNANRLWNENDDKS